MKKLHNSRATIKLFLPDVEEYTAARQDEIACRVINSQRNREREREIEKTIGVMKKLVMQSDNEIWGRGCAMQLQKKYDRKQQLMDMDTQHEHHSAGMHYS